MGQTYIVVNIDDRTYFVPSFADDDVGAKFLEFWADPSYAQALAILTAVGQGLGGGDLAAVDNQLVGSWVGDRIVTLGEYTNYSGMTVDQITSSAEWTNIGPRLATLIRVQQQIDDERTALNRVLARGLDNEFADIFAIYLSPAQARRIFVLRQEDLEQYTFIADNARTGKAEVRAVYAAGAALRRWQSPGIIDRESQFRALKKPQKDAVIAAFRERWATEIGRVERARRTLASIKRLSDKNTDVAVSNRDLARFAAISEQLGEALRRADLFNLTVPLARFAEPILVVSRDNEKVGEQARQREDLRLDIDNLVADARIELQQAVLARRPALRALVDQLRDVLANLAQLLTFIELREQAGIELVNRFEYERFRRQLEAAGRILDVDAIGELASGTLPGPAQLRGGAVVESPERQTALDEINSLFENQVRPIVLGLSGLIEAVDAETAADKLEVPAQEEKKDDEGQMDVDDDDDGGKRPPPSDADDSGAKRQRIECSLCGEDGVWQCQGCDETYYCSRACLHEDWELGGHARTCGNNN